MSQQWQTEGACFQHPDPDLWFWEKAKDLDERKLLAYRAIEAMDICSTCPVIDLCLKEGLKDINIEGWQEGGSVWGGKTTYERAMKVQMTSRERDKHMWTIKSEMGFHKLVKDLRLKIGVRR